MRIAGILRSAVENVNVEAWAHLELGLNLPGRQQPV